MMKARPPFSPGVADNGRGNDGIMVQTAAEAVHPAIIAAMANAVAHAVGRRPKSLPITPENILRLLNERPSDKA